MFCDKCGNKMEVKKSKAIPMLICVIVLLVIVIAVLGVLLIIIKPETKCNETEGGQQAANNTSEVQPSETTKKTNGDTVAADLDLSNVTAKPEDDKERTKKIEFMNAFYKHEKDDKYGKATMLFKNNNDTMIDIDVYINFYKDGQRIGSESGTGYNIKPNHLFVEEITVDFNEEYDSMDITYRASKAKSSFEEISIDSSKIKTNMEDSNILASYEREYDKESTYWAYIIYKKDGKVVYCDQSVDSSTNTTNQANFKFFLYNYKDLEYDSYEVDIYSAYKRVSY